MDFDKLFAIVLLLFLIWYPLYFRIYSHKSLILFNLLVGHDFNPVLTVLKRLLSLSVISYLLL